MDNHVGDHVLKATTLVVLACMMVAAPHAEAAITCGQVVSSLTPCLGYLQNGGPVPQPCCAGVSQLNSAASTTPDRQAACACFKQVATRMPGLNAQRASSLPGKCHVNIPYPINLSVDCSKVK